MKNSYLIRHCAAMCNPTPDGHEAAMVHLIRGWMLYAELDSQIGDDYVIGPGWEKIGQGLLVLLNGELGRLDGGALDATIRDALRSQGFKDE